MTWSWDAFWTRLGWLVDGLKDWQDLVGALVALFAAFLGVRYLDRQTRQAAQIEAARMERARAAARATLPLWISQVCAHAKEVADGLRPLMHAPGEAVPRSLRAEYSPAQIAPEIIDKLQDFVECDAEVGAVVVVSEILSEMQVLQSRIRSICQKDQSFIVTRSNIEVYAFQAAKIYALASCLFPYARREVETVDAMLTADRLHVALRVLDLDGHEMSRLAEMAERMTP